MIEYPLNNVMISASEQQQEACRRNWSRGCASRVGWRTSRATVSYPTGVFQGQPFLSFTCSSHGKSRRSANARQIFDWGTLRLSRVRSEAQTRSLSDVASFTCADRVPGVTELIEAHKMYYYYSYP